MRVRTTEKQVKEVEVTKESYIECDKCMSKISTNCYNAFDCEITLTTGESYPDGNYTTTKSIDLCENCSDTLFTVLESQGYRINVREND